jgi:hypothetical protein
MDADEVVAALEELSDRIDWLLNNDKVRSVDMPGMEAALGVISNAIDKRKEKLDL